MNAIQAASRRRAGPDLRRARSIIVIALAACAILVISVSGAISFLSTDGRSGCTEESAIKGIEPSIVQVYPEWFADQNLISAGTGFVVGQDGYVITSADVVINEEFGEADWVHVLLGDGRQPSGFIEEIDESTNIALIHVERLSGPPPVGWGHPASLARGESVLAAGFPNPTDELRDSEASFTRGVVITRKNSEGVRLIEHDSEIEHGAEGGPLVDLCGKVVGVNVVRMDRSERTSFAVSSSEVVKGWR